MNENELLLLGLLSEGDRHGYELHEFLEERLPYVSSMRRPTAYRVLNRLHRQGLLTRELERSGKRPERARYTITESGRARFEVLLRKILPVHTELMAPLNVPLLFLHRLPVHESSALLGQRANVLGERCEALRVGLSKHPRDVHERLILERNIALLEADMQWSTRALDWLSANIKPSKKSRLR